MTFSKADGNDSLGEKKSRDGWKKVHALPILSECTLAQCHAKAFCGF